MAMSHDELFEIFSWLPAKALYRFKSAGKSFSKVLEESYFALKQAQKSLTKDDSCFFIQPDISQRYNDLTELHPLPGEHLSSSVCNDVLGFLSNSARVLASSNGLILCRTTTKNPADQLFICNPATQSWLPIPAPGYLQETPDTDLKVVFECYHATVDSNDYKVFLFEDPTDWSSYFDCKVYLPSEDVWKATEKSFFTGGRRMRFDMPVHHNGALHFISDCYPSVDKRSPYFRPYIMSYNLESGMSRMHRVPKEARRGSHDFSCNMGIFKWGKVSSLAHSICLVRLRKSVFTIWVLTDYESSSWKRVLKVRVKAMGLKEQDTTVIGFTVMNGDLLVFATEKKVYSYGLTNERYMRLEEICKHGCETKVCFTSYSNTLRPCGTGTATLPSYTTSQSSEENVAVEFHLDVVP